MALHHFMVALHTSLRTIDMPLHPVPVATVEASVAKVVARQASKEASVVDKENSNSLVRSSSSNSRDE